MDLSILFGFIIGIILALPPGPVGVSAIEMGLSQGKHAGFKLALGNAIMDFFFCLAAIFATSALISILSDFTDEHPYAYLAFQIIVIAVFIVAGVLNLKSHKSEEDIKHDEERLSFIQKIGEKGPLYLGIGIAVSNLANPAFTPALAGITLWAHEIGLVTGTALSNILFALGFGLGNLFWINFVASMTHKFKHKFSEKMILRIKQFAGVTFIGFGAVLGVRLIAFSRWTETLKFIIAF